MLAFSRVTAKKACKITTNFSHTQIFSRKNAKWIRFLEIGRDAKMHFLLCNRVQKCNLRSVQHKSFAQFSIQSVAEDGGIETIGMRGMDTELVCAAGKRIEIDEECAI